MKKLEAEALLPDDVMYLIMSKLMVLPTYLARFSAVCKRWHQLVSDAWPELKHEHQTTPIALVPVVEEEEGKVVLYNLTGEYVNPLPRGFTRIIGSSFGWLILTNLTNTSVSLFNPLSKSHIRLPPFSPASYYLVKGVLSKPPPRQEQEDAHFDIAITVSPGYLRTCKTATVIMFLHVGNYTGGELESMQWVYEKCEILDVNSIGGRICILYRDGSIGCCKCSTNSFSHYCCVREDLPSWVFDIGDQFATTVYLLESSSSEPLVAFRYKDRHRFSGCWPTVGFKILTLTSISGNDNEMNKTWNWTEDKAYATRQVNRLNWTEIETLDNDVIFLSDKASILIQADYKLQASNSIYFPDEYGYAPRGINIGVFNVDQNCVTRFSIRPGVTEFRPKPPIWLQVPSYDEILKFSSIA